VCCEVGPDGAVWICDWYNLIIQHNPTPSLASAGIAAKRGRGNAYETPLRDKQHGRIYRVYPTGSDNDPVPVLSPEDGKSLVQGLHHSNLLWRTHAQRMLVELGDDLVADALEQQVSQAGVAAPHALQVLSQLSLISRDVLTAALRSKHLPTRRAAIMAATPDDLKRCYIRDGVVAANGRELAEVLVGLATAASDPEIGAAVYAVAKQLGDKLFAEPAMLDAWTMAARSQSVSVLAAAKSAGFKIDAPQAGQNLLANADFERVVDGVPAEWTDLRHYSGARPDAVTVRSSDHGRNGTRCLELRCDSMTDSGLALTVQLESGARYRLSGWVRTEDAVANGNAPGMMLNVHGGPRTRGLLGTTDWTELSLEFAASGGSAVVHCLFGGYGGAKGAAFYDDLSLVKIGGGHTLSGALVTLATAAKKASAEALEPMVRKFQPDPSVHEVGAAVFRQTCIACHGFDGKGVPGSFPPLDRSDWLTGDVGLPIKIVLHGLTGPVTVNGLQYRNAMTPLGTTLSDDEIAAVLTFVRQSWRNDAAAVDAAAVTRLRAANAERSQLWTAPELGR
jgi:mono/diheme cytochrome c family protein